MSVVVPPGGTRGNSFAVPAPMMRLMNAVVFRLFRNRIFAGGRLLVLTTVGARSGQARSSTLGYFPDGDRAWLIIGSANGAANHPAWIYNLAKHPDRVWVQIGSRKFRVIPETLEGEARTTAWQRVVAQAPNYARYATMTDREIPIVRLTPVAS